jgi:membrane-associated protease RseP (regulator of RpoE activity)
MKKISMAAAFVLILAGTLGGLYAAGVFTGGGSSSTAVAAQDNTSPSDQSVYLGVQLTQTPDGPTIAAVIADSPADKAGLQRGDVIKAIDGTSISSLQAVRTALTGKKAGDTVTVSITRNGNAQDVTVTLEAPPTPLPQAYPTLPELNGIPRDQLFSHVLSGSFQFTDKDGKTHTASIDLGTVTGVNADTKTVSVKLNSGNSEDYTISSDVTTVPSDLTKFADGDHVAVVSVDGNLRVLLKGGVLGVPFFGGMHGRGFWGGGWQGFPDKGNGEGGFDMPRGKFGGGL